MSKLCAEGLKPSFAVMPSFTTVASAVENTIIERQE